jgi:hypothetical protein
MKFSLPFLFGIVLLYSCNADIRNPGQNSKGPEGTLLDSREQILSSLKKNYVIHINEYEKNDLLRFYNKSYSDFLNDSIEYFKAVDSFFMSDSSILEYLIKRYENDTTRCYWVFSRSPHSSTAESWDMKFTKKEGVVVLFYDYLVHHNDKLRFITTSPSSVKDIITNISITDLKNWLNEKINNGSNISELANEFKRTFLRT